MNQVETVSAKAAKKSLKKVLLIHCQYLQKAGEDAVVEQECQHLAKHYQLQRFIRSNKELQNQGRLAQLGKMLWNRAICDELGQFLQLHDPDIVHVHNTFPLLSPAIFHVLGRWKKRQLKMGHRVKVVLTLHNFRLHCPQASLMRPRWHKGKVVGTALCQRCFARKDFKAAVQAGCYRHSKSMTWAVALMLSLHKFLRSWHNNVDTFIYLNQSQKILLSKVGFPEHKFVLKPNFLAAETSGQELKLPRLELNFRLLFIGRLSEEKGIRILLDAMHNLQNELGLSRGIELCIAGDGPLRSEVEQFVADCGQNSQRQAVQTAGISVQYLGQLDKTSLWGQLQRSHFVVLPSTWYEGMPVSLLESLSRGRPVISFCLGASAEVLHNQETGILVPFFQDAEAEQELRLSRIYKRKYLVQNLAEAIKGASLMNQERYEQMCLAARSSFQKHYTEEQNLQALRAIYQI